MSAGPIVVDESVMAHEASLRLRIPGDLDCLVGHFPGAPVVPGIVQVQWAIDAAQRVLRVEGEFARMQAVKFQRVMTPGLIVDLRIEWHAADGKVHFSYDEQGARFSSGRLLFRRNP